jgi:hypothetical protein
VFVNSIFKSYTPGKLLGITFALALYVVSSLGGAYGQKSQATPTRQSSIDAFAGGNFEEAYSGFSQLLEKYPKDPLYKFYSGASLVMLQREPEHALALLSQSVSGASVVRSLPPEAYFYLGRAQQMCGKFSEAISSFNSFTEDAGKKAARELGVPGFIQECEGRKGMLTSAAPAISKPPVAEPVTSSNLPGPADKTVSTAKPAEKQVEQITVSDKNADKQEVIMAGPDKIIPEKSKLPAEYESILDEALKYQSKADSLLRQAADQKKQLEKVPESEKSALRVKIYQNEMQAASFQKTADSKYSDAQTRMNSGKPALTAAKTDTALTVSKPVPVAAANEKKVDEQPALTVNTSHVAQSENKPAAIISLFQVLPKDAVYPDEAIKIDPEVPAGLIYRIQLAVFRNPAPPAFFKGITPVYGFKVQGSDKTNYYAGMFRRSADAKKALIAVKETGFKDAFIIALADRKAVSSDRAAMLENEWGNKSLINLSVSDTIPPALVFRIEVARTAKPMKPDAIEALKTTAGSRGLDVLHLSDGNLVYLIGKFITFESAEEFCDLLIRNNYRGAKVVAWLGNKEVPVETAKQLFKGLQ